MGLCASSAVRAEGNCTQDISPVCHLAFVLPTLLNIKYRAMAPGAKTLLKAITNPELPASDKVDQTKTPRQMTVNDWAQIVKAFQAWPFAPEVYFHLTFQEILLTCL